MMKAKYLNLVGLAYRARRCSLGEQAIVKDVQQQKAFLVLLAHDTGKATMKKITDKCSFYEIPCIIVDDRATLGQALGKDERVAVAILDKGFADKIQSLLV